ncbi:MAG: response regulator transcription factor [Halomonas sp.]|jgi:DNA-binding NarL/FixJ family response regulator|uniref:Response regulator transcription factor n=1 Tax=Billgrantia tianxiuensis TaxID=2497861 RepID=A0A6I6SV37_9GAMM|nr:MULTISPECIES: response regulator transcription factor [Halomonas]MCE8035298.1 response regulator transcription factor [Halomonas sp. MCCC 1A11057]MDX5432349.1 response regulator transcription factor [Halomonas sp.]QHC51895.1 response regulator transcription factor [Halomonas tianxiuensis]
MIRVLLVDDQQLVRSGIAGLLALTPDIEVAGEAASGEEAIGLVDELAPDVMLLDVRMPGFGGIEVLARLSELGRLPPTILLTTFDDDEALLAGVRAGARGFLLKDISLERLAEDIRRVATGGSAIRPSITERVLAGVRETRIDFDCLDPPCRLTVRETEILRLLASGLNNREVAHALGTAEGTVKNQVSSILSKLGVRDRMRAVLRGIELGWL